MHSLLCLLISCFLSNLLNQEVAHTARVKSSVGLDYTKNSPIRG